MIENVQLLYCYNTRRLNELDQTADGIRRQRKPPRVPATARQTNANPLLVN